MNFQACNAASVDRLRSTSKALAARPGRGALAAGAVLIAAAAALAAAPSARAADVGVSVHISEPGVYGRIDIGRFPQPQVVVAQPVLVAPRPVYAEQPVYMWVPPGHQKKWSKHCARYNACGVPVYFVTDQWYRQRVYSGPPRYAQPVYGQPVMAAPAPRVVHVPTPVHVERRDDRRWDRDGDERRGRGHGNDEDQGERGRGNGKGHGNGNGHGRGQQ